MAIAVGVTVGFLLWIVGVVLVAVLAEPVPGAPAGTPTPTPRAAAIAFLLGALVVAAGFLRVWLLARSAARSRGERPDGGRPALSWKAVISPRGAARLLFVPEDRHGVEDEVVARLGIARTWAALVVVTLVTGYVDLADVQVLAAATFNGAFETLVVGGVVLLVIVGAVYGRVAQDERAQALVALRRPVVVVVGAVLLLGAISLWGRVIGAWADGLPDGGSLSGGQLLLSSVVIVHGVWLVAFAVYCVIYLTRFVFRAAEGSPLLAPLVASTTAWAVVVLGAAEPLVGRPAVFGKDIPVSTPLAVRLGMSAMGAAAVTALAVFEWRRLAARNLSLRSGPWL